MPTTQLKQRMTFTPVDNDRLSILCGPSNENLRLIESHLGVEIYNRAEIFEIIGPEQAVHKTQHILEQMYQATREREPLNTQSIHLMLVANHKIEKMNHQTSIRFSKKIVKPLGQHQANYILRLHDNELNFAIGPAGTGKTYLAVARAIEALEKGAVKRLIFTRPAVEAGEKLGFLPGDLEEKVLPYLRPLYDALYEMLGHNTVNKYIEQNIIEIAPLAYMRGRTLSDAFIILDEAQNTTRDQMKMFLTRIGFGAFAVVTGDITQTDLPKGTDSGLLGAIEVLKDISGISFTYFDANDSVRHPLVQAVIKAYDTFELENKNSR